MSDATSMETVWRVCRAITGDCKNCPASEDIGGDECVRGCVLQAQEAINTVETGNPWRKTEGVRAPWVVLAPTENSASRVALGRQGNLPPAEPVSDPYKLPLEEIVEVLAGHFGHRPFADMAVDRRDLRDKLVDGFDVNEPTQDDCREAAKDILAKLGQEGGVKG